MELKIEEEFKVKSYIKTVENVDICNSCIFEKLGICTNFEMLKNCINL